MPGMVPAILMNATKFPIKYWQAEVEEEKTLEPGQVIPFSWDCLITKEGLGGIFLNGGKFLWCHYLGGGLLFFKILFLGLYNNRHLCPWYVLRCLTKVLANGVENRTAVQSRFDFILLLPWGLKPVDSRVQRDSFFSSQDIFVIRAFFSNILNF